MDRASLTLGEGEEACNVLLLGLRRVRLGRSRDNEVVLRVLPRSAANDKQSLLISGRRPQFMLTLGGEGLVLADHSAANPTELNGARVKGHASVPLDRPSEINVAGALRLRLLPFLDADGTDAAAVDHFAALGDADEIWRIAQKLKLRSVLIERTDNLPEAEKYLLVYRWAEVGRGGNCELAAAPQCGQRQCMRIIRRNERLWVEAVSPARCVSGSDGTLAAGYAMPLSAGMVLACASLPARVGMARQIGL
jgi:hypothetical protein